MGDYTVRRTNELQNFKPHMLPFPSSPHHHNYDTNHYYYQSNNTSKCACDHSAVVVMATSSLASFIELICHPRKDLRKIENKMCKIYIFIKPYVVLLFQC